MESETPGDTADRSHDCTLRMLSGSDFIPKAKRCPWQLFYGRQRLEVFSEPPSESTFGGTGESEFDKVQMCGQRGGIPMCVSSWAIKEDTAPNAKEDSGGYTLAMSPSTLRKPAQMVQIPALQTAGRMGINVGMITHPSKRKGKSGQGSGQHLVARKSDFSCGFQHEVRMCT